MQIDTARLLARPLFRAVGWATLLWSFVLGLLIVWWFGQNTEAGAGGIVLALRLGAVCLAAGMAFVLDDPTEDTTCMAPVSLLLRRTMRIALTLPPTAVAWLLLIHLANSSPSVSADIPAWPFTLEFLALSAVALATAAVGSSHLVDRVGGIAGAGAPPVVAAVAAFLPGRMRLWNAMPGTSGYESTARWWWALLLISGVVIVSCSGVGRRSLRSFIDRDNAAANGFVTPISS